MPFDNTPQTIPFADEIAIVEAMQDMLQVRTNWVQCVQTMKFDNGTVAHCLIGALRAVQSEKPGKMVNKYTPAGTQVAKVMRTLAGGSIAAFNDTNGHGDVLQLLKRVRSHFMAV